MFQHGQEYSINLAYLDSRYRGLFADVVQNNLPNSEKIRLFGEDFTAAISGLENYVVTLQSRYSIFCG